MSQIDPFLRDPSTYAQDLNITQHYLNTTAFYISRTKQVDFEVAKQKIASAIENKTFPIRNPEVRHFQRDPSTGDTTTETTPLLTYIKDIRTNHYTVAPTFTCYLSSQERPSMLVEFVKMNKERRSVAKKQGLQARAENNEELYVAKDIEQNNMKIYNNSLSGAFAAEGSILRNPSAHSTLTSTTRVVTSLSNANNEKILAGNRYYPNAETILENIAAICLHQDLNRVQQTVEQFELVYPTVEQTMQVILKSAKYYMVRPENNIQIRQLVSALSPVERAAFCYTSDLYHLRQFNETFMRKLLEELVYPDPSLNVPEVDYAQALSRLDESIINFVHQLYTDKLKGIGKKYEKLPVEIQRELYVSYYNTLHFFQKYELFIRTFFTSDIMPNSVSEIQHMLREVVVISDTDSTMFSVDEWISWYFGKIEFHERSYAIAAAVGLLTTQTIRHLLALLSAQLNVANEYITVLAMKPEFVFPVFATTAVAKHYFASISIKEGNVFSENDIEIKGVHLKNSALPQSTVKEAQGLMKQILDTVEQTGQIQITPYIRKLYDKEQAIIKSIHEGSTEYFRMFKIKSREAYSDTSTTTPYQHYELWTEALTKYLTGYVPPLPFDAVKIPITLDNKTKLSAWVNSISNSFLAADIQAWLTKYNKSQLGTLYIPLDYILQHKIPDFIVPIIDYKRVVMDNTLVYRLILQSLGVYVPDEYLLSEWLVQR